MPVPSRLGPRRLAWLAVLVGALGLALLTPGVDAPAAPADPHPSVRLLTPDSPLFDRAQLADPALLVLPPILASVGAGEGAVPEATPFPPVPPDLRSPPGGALRLPLAAEAGQPAGFRPEVLPELTQPLETLGQGIPRSLPPARAPLFRATSLDGRWVIERSLESDEEFKSLLENDLGNKSLPVLGLGIDAFGLQAPPVLLTATGNAGQDQALMRWAARQPWTTWLPPGAYRVEIGP